MLPFALTVKLGRYPKRTYRDTFISRTRCAAFLYSASSFAPGTLDGVVVISNSFLAQSRRSRSPRRPHCLNLHRINDLPGFRQSRRREIGRASCREVEYVG